MAVCPNGHDSAGEDFCDICGMRITGTPGSTHGPGTTGSSSAMGTPGTGPVPPPAIVGEPCPRCGTAQSGQFCEACGYNFNATQPFPSAPSARSVPPAPSVPSVPTAPPVASAPSVPPTRAVPGSSHAPAVWTVVVSSDRDFYERVRVASGPDWAEVPFPAYAAERRFKLTGNQMRIGRRSVSRGLDPEIDLTGPPADPGISRLHAVLIATPDGSWAVLDPGSANGTLVNGNEIPTGNQVPLHDGDRINLGAWTAITVRRG
jgi:hypothetical protein